MKSKVYKVYLKLPPVVIVATSRGQARKEGARLAHQSLQDLYERYVHWWDHLQVDAELESKETWI